jgi:hypothetical protein
MPPTEFMGWNRKQARWFKKAPWSGKVVAVGCPTLKKLYPSLFKDRTKDGSREAANQWWLDQIAAQEAKPDEREHAEYWYRKLDEAKAHRRWFLQQEHAEGAARQAEQISAIGEILEAEQLPHPDSWAFPEVHVLEAYKRIVADGKDELWADRLARTQKVKAGHRVSELVLRFVKAIGSNVIGKQITPDRVHNINYHLQHFVAWFLEENETDDIRQVIGLTLTEFRSHLLDQCDEAKMELSYARDVMSSARRFIRWCWDTAEVLEKLPKNIDSKELSIEVPPTQVEPWTDAEVKLVLSKASERQKLYYVLMLNTGMSAKEISTMSNEEPKLAKRPDYFHVPRLNWETGRLTRKRAKTRKHKNVPIVEYKLWDSTMVLLKKYGNREGTVLRNEDGGPLVGQTQRGQVKASRNDCIGREFLRLRDKLNQKKVVMEKPLYSLRATAATKLEESDNFARYIEHFLGHSPKGMANRNYVAPSRERFDAALAWLEARAFADWGIGYGP